MTRQRAVVLVAVLAGLVLAAAAIRDGVVVEQAETVAQGQAETVDRVCTVDPATAAQVGADCVEAAQVARDGVDGAAGRPGDPGRGVLGTSVQGGRLVVAYSDGTTQDAGEVVGQAGTPGAAGRGITDSDVQDGRLLVTYSDGTSADLGPVVGAAGRGIASTAAVDGRLVVTYSDGTVEDAGPLPPGPAGERGAQGERGEPGAPAPSVQSETRTYSDGTVERCTRTGGPDTDPEMACTVTGAPTEPQGG